MIIGSLSKIGSQEPQWLLKARMEKNLEGVYLQRDTRS
jgi:hypothetical protein